MSIPLNRTWGKSLAISITLDGKPYRHPSSFSKKSSQKERLVYHLPVPVHKSRTIF